MSCHASLDADATPSDTIQKTPLTPTLPVGLADAYASLRIEVGSAYTLVFFVIIIPLLVAMQWASRPRDRHSTS